MVEASVMSELSPLRHRRPVSNHILVDQLVSDEMASKNVLVSKTPKHDVPQQLPHEDLVPPVQA